MDELFGRYRNLIPANGEFSRAAKDWRPVANISETGKEFLIKAELPEVDRKDVHVVVEDGRINISGERTMKEEESDATQHRVESFYGTFSRSFALPKNIDEDKIYAKSKDGVLNVHLPKTKVSEPKPIEIEVK
jgi:HSP20 family protein